MAREQQGHSEKRYRAEVLTYQAERCLRGIRMDFGLQFARELERRIETLIQNLRDALEREDDHLLEMIQADLQDALYELNRVAYLHENDDDDGWELVGGVSI